MASKIVKYWASEVLIAKPDNMTSIPRTHTVEGEH